MPVARRVPGHGRGQCESVDSLQRQSSTCGAECERDGLPSAVATALGPGVASPATPGLWPGSGRAIQNFPHFGRQVLKGERLRDVGVGAGELINIGGKAGEDDDLQMWSGGPQLGGCRSPEGGLTGREARGHSGEGSEPASGLCLTARSVLPPSASNRTRRCGSRATTSCSDAGRPNPRGPPGR